MTIKEFKSRFSLFVKCYKACRNCYKGYKRLSVSAFWFVTKDPDDLTQIKQNQN